MAHRCRGLRRAAFVAIATAAFGCADATPPERTAGPVTAPAVPSLAPPATTVEAPRCGSLVIDAALPTRHPRERLEAWIASFDAALRSLAGAAPEPDDAQGREWDEPPPDRSPLPATICPRSVVSIHAPNFLVRATFRVATSEGDVTVNVEGFLDRPADPRQTRAALRRALRLHAIARAFLEDDQLHAVRVASIGSETSSIVVQRAGRTTVCLRDRAEPLCWDAGAVDDAWFNRSWPREEDVEREDGIVRTWRATLSSRNGDDVRVTLVDLERRAHAPVRTLSRPPRTGSRPLWFPDGQVGGSEWRRRIADEPPATTAPFVPLPISSIDDVNSLLAQLGTASLGRLETDLDAIAVTDGAERMLCVGADAGRACTSPIPFDSMLFVYDEWADVDRIPLAAGESARLLVVRDTLEDGGSGEASGAGGERWLEVYERSGAELRLLVAFPVGAMRWTTWKRFEGTANEHFERDIDRYFHEHEVTARGCIHLRAAERESAWAAGSYVRVGRARSARVRDRQLPLVAVPDAIEARDGIAEVPREPRCSENEDSERCTLPVPDLEGYWLVGPEGIRRVARDEVEARCLGPEP